MGDLFHEDVPWKWINDVAGTMCLAKQHTFMVLTKRPDRMLEFIRRWKNGDATEGDGVFGSLLFGDNDPTAYKAPLPNLWLGVTAENQEMADQRIPILLQTPAAKRFVSIEPMLGPVDLGRIKIANGVVECAGGRLPPIDWVICGGETGAGARFMHPHWVENLRDQCTESGVPFFFKGWGTQAMKKSDPDYMKLDGREWKEFPEVSR
jgi:protein gp37